MYSFNVYFKKIQGLVLYRKDAICKKNKNILWCIYFFTDDDVQVTYLIEVPEQCTQCTL